MEEYFPSDEQDNVLYNFFKKIKGKDEVSIATYVQAFPQDLLQECTCSEYIAQCVASHWNYFRLLDCFPLKSSPFFP